MQTKVKQKQQKTFGTKRKSRTEYCIIKAESHTKLMEKIFYGY